MSFLRGAAIALLLLAGCAGAGAEPQPDSGTGMDSGAGPDAWPSLDSGTGCDSTLTYANFGAAFLSSHCNSCHGWTQQSVQSSGTGLASIVVGGFMPPGGGGLTQAQRQQFADWVDCGAP
jgi:hypothetical protein